MPVSGIASGRVCSQPANQACFFSHNYIKRLPAPSLGTENGFQGIVVFVCLSACMFDWGIEPVFEEKNTVFVNFCKFLSIFTVVDCF